MHRLVPCGAPWLLLGWVFGGCWDSMLPGSPAPGSPGNNLSVWESWEHYTRLSVVMLLCTKVFKFPCRCKN